MIAPFERRLGKRFVFTLIGTEVVFEDVLD
jgi:hypothetical protein